MEETGRRCIYIYIGKRKDGLAQQLRPPSRDGLSRTPSLHAEDDNGLLWGLQGTFCPHHGLTGGVGCMGSCSLKRAGFAHNTVLTFSRYFISI